MFLLLQTQVTINPEEIILNNTIITKMNQKNPRLFLKSIDITIDKAQHVIY